MIPYILIIILSNISFIFCQNKVTTYCENLNVTAFTRSKVAYTKIIQKWNTTISNRGYYATNGCLCPLSFSIKRERRNNTCEGIRKEQ